jgi:hypothetical protein
MVVLGSILRRYPKHLWYVLSDNTLTATFHSIGSLSMCKNVSFCTQFALVILTHFFLVNQIFGAVFKCLIL